MASERDIMNDVNDFWESWFGRGENPREYDCSEGRMREKGKQFNDRKAIAERNVSEYEKIRQKYKKREE